MNAEQLKEKKCVPCRGGIPPMEPEQARMLVTETPGWILSDDATRISRQFTLPTFPAAIAFVQRVAELAEEEGHHPDFEIHYNKVNLILWTHKIGGLHENDFIMAAKIGDVAG